jgi:hypothetical protein
MSIVLIRGTGGSGKTYIAEQVIKALGTIHAADDEITLGPKGKLGGYIWRSPPVTIMGRYGNACGGCDTIGGWPGGPDDICNKITSEAARGQNVLWEGIAVSSYGQKRLLAMGPALTVIQLDTSLEECVKSIYARRAAKGNAKPLDLYHTERKHKALFTTTRSNAAVGIATETHSRATALPRVMELLGLGKGDHI